MVTLGFLAFSSRSALAGTCPAVGIDTDCGAIITITDKSASVTFTGQGPYDNIEDTLVGVVNNSKQTISSIGLRSALNIFAFDGDGICGTDPNTGQSFNPAPKKCPFGPTTYEGPGVSFSDINFNQTEGKVNFAVPLAAGGGTSYFSLEEDISSAYSCPDIVNNAVTPGILDETRVKAKFIPNLGLSLQDAAKFCGFKDFDWQQLVTNLPLPSPMFQIGNDKPLRAPPTFFDPPPGGYTFQLPDGDNSYPFFYNPNNGELASHQTTNMLSFIDGPSDVCLPGGDSTGIKGCDGAHAPEGSFLGFTTHLVGILPDGSPLDLGIGFSWISTFNGTTGGVSMTKNELPADPGSGTGGVTITNVQNTTNYQYSGIVVTTVNDIPVPTTVDTAPPAVTVATTPSKLWPPNESFIPVTVSGNIRLIGTSINSSTATYTVSDEYGLVQPGGNFSITPTGDYSFQIELQASRRGDDYDGRHYTITISAQDNAGHNGSSSASVIVPHDQSY
jgi:hypothetical protein